MKKVQEENEHLKKKVNGKEKTRKNNVKRKLF